jgi:hypothetical protein
MVMLLLLAAAAACCCLLLLLSDGQKYLRGQMTDMSSLWSRRNVIRIILMQ